MYVLYGLFAKDNGYDVVGTSTHYQIWNIRILYHSKHSAAWLKVRLISHDITIHITPVRCDTLNPDYSIIIPLITY
jgi:hypothetical protein